MKFYLFLASGANVPMKLPYSQLDLPTALAEFDVWITPSTGEIRDTERFRHELESVSRVFDMLAHATHEFVDASHCSPNAIADTIVNAIAEKSAGESHSILQSLASVLFLVTGKSDNNAKCQLPLHIRDVAKWEGFPAIKRSKTSATFLPGPVPRELKAEKYMKAVVDLAGHRDQQLRLLGEFARFVLSDAQYVDQLWSVGRSYCILKAFGKHQALLTPLVVFQVRGSVSASGGHDPEELLRCRFLDWGLQAGVDFNLSDVVVSEEQGGGRRKKTRAYDFVVPYKTPGWKWRVFVQCQFYARDSGSVSHKNVDQTSSSRTQVRARFPQAVFIEFLDGAGYFSSLNGDLKNLLSMDDTTSFFQIRTAAIRLRRELQRIGLLCPLEIEHAILRSGGDETRVNRLLQQEGYAAREIKRSLDDCLQRGVLKKGRHKLAISNERRAITRRYFLLDVTACFAAPPSAGEGKLVGSLVVPGYGPFFGAKLDAIAAKAKALAPPLAHDWAGSQTILEDIRWLCEQGLAMSC